MSFAGAFVEIWVYVLTPAAIALSLFALVWSVVSWIYARQWRRIFLATIQDIRYDLRAYAKTEDPTGYALAEESSEEVGRG